jgi:hypothetical protein
MRALLLIHRYLGIAIGLVMAMWCASGLVMLYVSYPALDHDQRLQGLEPITWQGCCATSKIATALGVDVADDFSIEMVAGRPVLNVFMAVGERRTFDLQSGEPAKALTRDQSLIVAAQHAKALGINVAAHYQALIERDQWTVSEQFNRDRPLHHIAFDDGKGTELYVSSRGEVVQQTTSRQRFWNWLGAVPHWLYPTVLRQHGAIWSQFVIWLSLAGVFLTLIGLYIGIAHWRAMKGRGWSPYRGLSLWHHLSGLFFGVLTLTWVGSGLVSMSPWGLFSGSGFKEERDRVRDVWIDGGQIAVTLQTLANANAPSLVSSVPGATRIESAPLHGKLFLLTYHGAETQRLDAKTLVSTPLKPADVDRVAKTIAEDSATQTALLTEGDDYYYSGHDPVSLPVYRISIDDADHTRYYLNPSTADIVGKVGAAERWYRWLFEGLHRWDFSATLRTRPWWDLLVVPLMLGVTLVCFTGVYMGYRRLTPKRASSKKSQNQIQE